MKKTRRQPRQELLQNRQDWTSICTAEGAVRVWSGSSKPCSVQAPHVYPGPEAREQELKL